MDFLDLFIWRQVSSLQFLGIYEEDPGSPGYKVNNVI